MTGARLNGFTDAVREAAFKPSAAAPCSATEIRARRLPVRAVMILLAATASVALWAAIIGLLRYLI